MIEETRNYIPRTEYSRKVRPYVGQSVIKVFTGQRRVGKSYVMRQTADEVAERDPQANILFIDKELLAFSHLRDARSLYDYVREGRKEGASNYLFVNEVQEIADFHTALRSMQGEGLCDIYCTGSNAQILSGELATMPAGRYIEIPVHTLSYEEFLRFNKTRDSDEALSRYITIGGMPYVHHLPDTTEVAYEYLKNVYASILLKDVAPQRGHTQRAFPGKSGGLSVRQHKFHNLGQQHQQAPQVATHPSAHTERAQLSARPGRGFLRI